MSRAELNSRSIPAPDAGIANTSRASLESAGYLYWFRLQYSRGDSRVISVIRELITAFMNLRDTYLPPDIYLFHRRVNGSLSMYHEK